MFVCVYLSYHTTQATRAERKAEKQCQRQSANSGQKTRSCIEGGAILTNFSGFLEVRFFLLFGPTLADS